MKQEIIAGVLLGLMVVVGVLAIDFDGAQRQMRGDAMLVQAASSFAAASHGHPGF